MEPALLSGPLGHMQWETEQPFPLGFHSLDSDNGSVLCQNKSGQTGLDICNSDQDQTLKSLGEAGLFQNKVPHLDPLLNIAEFSCGDFKFERDHKTNSQVLPQRTEELSCPENTEPSEKLSDSTLSWLFSPGLFEVSGKVTTFDQSHQPLEPPDETSHALSSGANAQTVNVPSSLTENIDISSVLLVDFFSEEHLSPRDESVTEEATGLPLPQYAVSPDTGDKGLCTDQVTDLSLTSTSTTQSLPENCLPHNHTSPLEDCFGRSVPLLDIDVPLYHLGLCPASPVSPSLLSIKPTGSTVTANQGDVSELEQLSESLTEAANVQDDGRLEDTDQNEEMKDRLQCEIKNLDSTMALDLSLTTDEVQREEHPDTLQTDTLTTEATPEPNEDSNHLKASDILDFSVQDSSVEAERTNKQTVETLCLSKMVGDDSVPLVPSDNTSEEDVSPLKAVFDALDQDGDGFVRIEEFMEFAAAYGADQVKDLTKFLDPSGLGVISFEDFHRGISAISNGGPEPQLYGVHYSPGDGAVGCPEEYDEQNEVTDSAYLGSESTYSECETFTDEDTGTCVAPEMHEDVETDSGIEATLHDPEDRSNRFSLNSELHNHSSSLVTVIGGEEEHFEDFGESNTSELLLETSVAETESDDSPALPKTPEQLNGSSLLSPSAGKRLSSKKVARHLLQNNSMTLDTVSDLTRDILELADNDITDKVLLLERRVAELEKESEASGEQHTRLRQENLQLVHRANAFEEQLKEQEVYADEQLQQETRRHKDAISKLERERGLELENLQARLQQLDEENSELRSCIPCLRANIERLEEEKKKLQDETETLSDRLEDEMENRRKLANKLSHERHINQKEKESTQELIEDLRKQLEHLQLYKLEIETKRGRTPGAGLQEYQTKTREAELEHEIKRLKQDNRSLKEQNDELNGQIINLSIQGAKTLMSASFSDSLAAEISSVSRTELMETVHKQEEINYRLQDYIDKIIVAIMECNPSILEVK
ncbi:rab11 family-interacting protein 3 isoform X2 [Eucyclogobius newberryi]|uniref:rab11 family-interacting protein 3 isoform X2 n=1 Tax=Eucyclogobius newberryi TaxID=166745 RepID=UPI003B5C6CCE